MGPSVKDGVGELIVASHSLEGERQPRVRPYFLPRGNARLTAQALLPKSWPHPQGIRVCTGRWMPLGVRLSSAHRFFIVTPVLEPPGALPTQQRLRKWPTMPYTDLESG